MGDIHRTGMFYRSRHLWFVMEIATLMPNHGAASNSRPAGQLDGSDNLSAIVAADRAFPAAVAELDR